MNHHEFLSKVAVDLDGATGRHCDCEPAKVTSLVVMAYVDGEPYVYSPPEFADDPRVVEAVARAEESA